MYISIYGKPYSYPRGISLILCELFVRKASTIVLYSVLNKHIYFLSHTTPCVITRYLTVIFNQYHFFSYRQHLKITTCISQTCHLSKNDSFFSLKGCIFGKISFSMKRAYFKTEKSPLSRKRTRCHLESLEFLDSTCRQKVYI